MTHIIGVSEFFSRGDIMRGVTYQDSNIIGWGDTLGGNILVGGGDIIGVG